MCQRANRENRQVLPRRLAVEPPPRCSDVDIPIPDSEGRHLYSRSRKQPIDAGMLWFFARQKAQLHYEIRKHRDSDDYEIVITHPDGRQEVEQYSDATGLLRRSADLQDTLRAEGWQPLG